jgi:hypothetical protein
MSVDPDDVTRFAIRNLGAADMTYGSAVLPGAMVLVAYLSKEHDVEGMEQKPSAMIPILDSLWWAVIRSRSLTFFYRECLPEKRSAEENSLNWGMEDSVSTVKRVGTRSARSENNED